MAMMQGGDWTNLDSLHYIWTDALGTPREITNANTQKLVWRWANIDPFGSNKAQAIRGFEYNQRFAGQVYDKESGLHYNHFRDYNPKTGRYIQSDPIGLNGGINTYAYVGSNPLRFVDPLGLYGVTTVDAYCRQRPDDCREALGIPPIPPLFDECEADEPSIWKDVANVVVAAVTRGKGSPLKGIGKNKPKPEVGGGKGPYKGPDAVPPKKQRNAPPPPAPEAEGRPHTIIERPGRDGQYTTHNPDGNGGWSQYRGSGKPHGDIARPNVKFTSPNTDKNGVTHHQVDKETGVRSANPDEIPRGR